MEYVKPNLLTNNDHEYYVHICGRSPREGLKCDSCPIETRIRCLRDHTTYDDLRPIMARGCDEDEACRIYWEAAPAFVIMHNKKRGHI